MDNVCQDYRHKRQSLNTREKLLVAELFCCRHDAYLTRDIDYYANGRVKHFSHEQALQQDNERHLDAVREAETGKHVRDL